MPQTIVRQSKSMTATVVEKIADAEGIDMNDVTPLVESVDPDAIEAIFASPESSDHITIEFNHCGYRITIDGGRVSIDTPADES